MTGFLWFVHLYAWACICICVHTHECVCIHVYNQRNMHNFSQIILALRVSRTNFSRFLLLSLFNLFNFHSVLCHHVVHCIAGRYKYVDHFTFHSLQPSSTPPFHIFCMFTFEILHQWKVVHIKVEIATVYNQHNNKQKCYNSTHPHKKVWR